MKKQMIALLAAVIMLAGCGSARPVIETIELDGVNPSLTQDPPDTSLPLDGNSYVNTRVTISDQTPYWGMTVRNEGNYHINVDVQGEIFQVKPDSARYIYSREPWKEGEYDLGFSTDPGSEMMGEMEFWSAAAPETVSPQE